MSDRVPLGAGSDSPWFTLSCAKAGCDKRASHVVVQATDMSLLFRSGAGVMCRRHAEDCEGCGGCGLPLQSFVDAVNAENRA